MKILLSFLFIILYQVASIAQQVVLSDDEKRLYEMINEYRAQNGLPKIPLSLSLTYVAQEHAKDLHYNRPFSNVCNMHSWSDRGNWSGCCYTSDHSQSRCMWDKPRELTGYTGNGYEIAHGYASYSSYQGHDVTPENSFNGWKSSPPHNAVILNQNMWSSITWKAMGVGIFKDFAVVWFGDQPDTEPLQIKNQQVSQKFQSQDDKKKEEEKIGLKPSMGNGGNNQQQPTKTTSVLDVRDRMTVRFGAGLNYNYGSLVKDPRAFEGKVLSTQFHGMIGYRLKENNHQHSNVIGVFLNYSRNTARSSGRYLDASEQMSLQGIFESDSSSRNLEVEVGFLGREWFRLSAGMGRLSYKNAAAEKVAWQYYILTPGFDVGIPNFRFYLDLPLLFGQDFENPIFRPTIGLVIHLNFLHR